MDIAVHDLEEYSPVEGLSKAEEATIFDPGRPHAELIIRVYNAGNVPLYIRTKDGVINYAAPRPTIWVSGQNKGTAYVEVVHKNTQNSGQKRDAIFRYRLNPKLLCKGCAVHLKQLGLYVSPDQNFLSNMIPDEETQPVDRFRDLVHKTLAGMKQCPISVIISDPTGTLDHLFAIVDRRIYRIPVLHTREYGKTCIVRFAGVDQMDSEAIYDFTLDEMLEAFKTQKSFVPHVGNYQFQLFSKLEDAQEVLSKLNTEEVRAALGVTAREKEAARLEYSAKIAELERENASLRKQLEILSGMTKIAEDEQKRANTITLQKLQVDKEQAKVEKANKDVATASIGQSSTAIKAAAVAIPAILGGLGVFLAKMGVVGVGVSSACASIPLVGGLLSGLGAGLGIGAIVKSTTNVVSSIAGAVWDGITSVGSWLTSWF